MLFTRKFLEALGCKNLYKLRGSTGSGRKHQNLLPASSRAKPEPNSFKILKASQAGIHRLSVQDIQELKQLYGITDLEKEGSRNLGNTGITMYIDNNQYFIKK